MGFVKFQKGKVKTTQMVTCIKCHGLYPADKIREHQAMCQGKAA
jgi:hypothetical protein